MSDREYRPRSYGLAAPTDERSMTEDTRDEETPKATGTETPKATGTETPKATGEVAR